MLLFFFFLGPILYPVLFTVCVCELNNLYNPKSGFASSVPNVGLELLINLHLNLLLKKNICRIFFFFSLQLSWVAGFSG